MWSSGVASPFHVGAWLLWLAVAMLAALSTRNPFYLAVLIAVALVVWARLSRGDPARTGEDAPGRTRSGRLLLVAVVGVTLAAALFKGLWPNSGATVLWRLPGWWLDFGRVVTLEGLASAGLDALQILAILAVFLAFSAGADYYALLRSTPAFMHQVGLITSIAITFVPQTVTRFVEIREAQALRGHRVRRVGDLVPLVVPLLSGGMERSIDLAEAMEARGFSRRSAGERAVAPLAVQGGLALGLGLVLVGGAMFAFSPSDVQWGNWLAILGGLGLVGLTLWAVGRGVRRTRYRRSVWHSSDTALVAVVAAAGAILLAYLIFTPGALAYTPFPRVALPGLDPVPGLAIAALAAPTVIAKLAAEPLEPKGEAISL